MTDEEFARFEILSAHPEPLNESIRQLRAEAKRARESEAKLLDALRAWQPLIERPGTSPGTYEHGLKALHEAMDAFRPGPPVPTPEWLAQWTKGDT